MSATPTATLGPAHPPPPRQRIDWSRARGALRQLIRDPERTECVFELIDALGGKSDERLFQRFRAHPEGRRLLLERPSLLAALGDREHLRSLPPGSFGRTYADFMAEEQLQPDGLVDASQPLREADREALDPERRWFYDRLRDMHDLWHVLTGYGRDVAGEVANLAFSHAQIRNRGIGAIVLAGAVLGPKRLDCFWQRYLFRAWRRGRRCLPLVCARYEELLPLPLEDVRDQLQLDDPVRAHPNGILVFDAEDGQQVAAP